MIEAEAEFKEVPFRYYAVVRNNDGPAAYVVNGATVYLDRDNSGPNQRFVPRAILDTGLPGAFWGFNEHGNPAASFLVAKRLLESEFPSGAGNRTHKLITTVAAGHAILIHRQLLSGYSSAVLAALKMADDQVADIALLKAFINMAQAGTKHEDKASFFHLIRSAIKISALRRPIFGETLRLLNDHFNILVDIARSGPSDPTLASDVSAVNNMLHSSYIGGQSATYLGFPKLEDRAAWRNVVASKKKTLKN
ncbi:hypothetical protein [Zhengella mangrovi]|uniref:hypothetical protein n=1 Tax=Zhengella mangrovi TaxID=1982044 RepID=UPI001054F527|nr:hypothetical protein [Zhengella mangrovi]